MKTVTLTALMALIVAIPVLLNKKKLVPIKIDSSKNEAASSDENRRYSIDDFIT